MVPPSTTDHNKVLGIIHLAYGAFNVLVLLLISVFVFGVVGIAALGQEGGALGLGIVGVIMLFFISFNLIMTIPEFVAGYALLKRKKWAKGACIVSAILESLSFPFGTALCVYTLWFIFSEQGRRIYDMSNAALPAAPPSWAGASVRGREPQYVPPVSPPDWR
jgi:hypothetical protein